MYKELDGEIVSEDVYDTVVAFDENMHGTVLHNRRRFGGAARI
jgi:hypothetical protein